MAEERLANTSSTELYERLKVENMIVGWKSCTNIYLENMMISEVGKGKTNGKVEMCRGWLASWTPWPRDVKKDQSWPISWYRRAQISFLSLFSIVAIRCPQSLNSASRRTGTRSTWSLWRTGSMLWSKILPWFETKTLYCSLIISLLSPVCSSCVWWCCVH